MSSAQWNAGQSHGQAQAKTEDWIESAKNTANATHDRATNAANCNQDTVQRQKDESAGFFQQTGEQMIHMAQGAIDGVKHTLGVGDENQRK